VEELWNITLSGFLDLLYLINQANHSKQLSQRYVLMPLALDPHVSLLLLAKKPSYPLIGAGHRLFRITRTHSKGEKDSHGNILNVANYEIAAVDQADPALAAD